MLLRLELSTHRIPKMFLTSHLVGYSPHTYKFNDLNQYQPSYHRNKLKNFFQNIISEIEGVNTFEAVTELQQDQNMLEASFSTIVKLANMSLAKFI